MTTPDLPARISLGWRRDKHLSFTGLEENRSIAKCELTDNIRALVLELYADATACDGTNIAKPRLGNHFRVRWATQGGDKLRFYLASVKKLRPKFELPEDDRTIKLRGMVEEAYDLARTDEQHAENAAEEPAAFDKESADWLAKAEAGELKEPGQ